MHERVSHRERVIAMHFWYPPQLIPVVEVCGSPDTGPDVVAWACDAVRACGKKPAVIEREIPGFIGNRLQFALLREAWALWASGAATAESIDACVRLTIGRRLGVTGPIESADIAGLATMLAFAEGVQPHLDVAPVPPRAIGDVAKRGGIYDWDKRDAGALRAARTEELFRSLEVDRQGWGTELRRDGACPRHGAAGGNAIEALRSTSAVFGTVIRPRVGRSRSKVISNSALTRAAATTGAARARGRGGRCAVRAARARPPHGSPRAPARGWARGC